MSAVDLRMDAITQRDTIRGMAQITLRNNRRLKAAMRSSRLPVIKTLESFDFSFQPSIQRQQIESLHELGLIDRKQNVRAAGTARCGQNPFGNQLGHCGCLARPACVLRHAHRFDHLVAGGPSRPDY